MIRHVLPLEDFVDDSSMDTVNDILLVCTKRDEENERKRRHQDDISGPPLRTGVACEHEAKQKQDDWRCEFEA